MPYMSEAQRDRAKWLLISELVELVRTAEACSAEDAQRQIRAALADGALWPLKWEPRPRC
jgi:hypothetical protein